MQAFVRINTPEPVLQLVARANEWAQELRLNRRALFDQANATVSIESMLSTYPGPLQLVTVQVPVLESIFEAPLLWRSLGPLQFSALCAVPVFYVDLSPSYSPIRDW